jgi:hypothetical protein
MMTFLFPFSFFVVLGIDDVWLSDDMKVIHIQ